MFNCESETALSHILYEEVSIRGKWEEIVKIRDALLGLTPKQFFRIRIQDRFQTRRLSHFTKIR